MCDRVAFNLIEALDGLRAQGDVPNGIPSAHATTFQRIFEPPRDRLSQAWSSFTDWLAEGKDIYWITGKASSRTDEIHLGFELLCRQASANLKICLLIDGLNEFEVDHSSLTDLLKDASDKPKSHPGDLAMQYRGPVFARRLNENIAVRSEGVFPWVSLVVRSLMTRLSNRDRISDLQARLEQLPMDLEQLYQRMFDSIEPFYVRHAYHLLEIAMAAQGSVTALALSFANEGDEGLVIVREIAPLGDSEKLERYDTAIRRLQCCYKGFLEITKFGDIEANFRCLADSK
ncbi:hypothetical protein F5B21DRAFT_500711 [Xylaria acuta]|nr:hypothetical protein F5B21DRAFT_500711 [Xylaria acuta]